MKKLLSLLTISVLSASSITTVISCSGPKASETANQLVKKIASGTSGKTFSIANSTDLTVAGDKTIIINKIVSVLSLTGPENTMLTNGTITGSPFVADGLTKDPLTIRPKDSAGLATNQVIINFTMKKHIETANELVDKITSSAVGKTFSIANSTDLTVSGNKTIIINKIVSVLSLTGPENTMLTNGTITGSPFVADGLTKDPLTIRPKDSAGLATNQVIINFTMKKHIETANELVDKITSSAVGKTFSIANSTDLTVSGNKTVIINKIVSVLSLTGPENTMLTNGTIIGSPFVADGSTKDPLIITPKDSTGPATKTASLDFTMDKKEETAANKLVDKITSGAVGKTFSIAYSTDLTVSGNKTVIINQIVSVLSLNPDEKTMLTNGTITGSPFVADGLTKDPLTIRPKDSTGLATKTASLDFTMKKHIETANELVDKITSSAVGKTFSIAYSTDLTVSGNKTVIINQIVSVLSLNPDEKTMLTNGTITGSPFVADGLTKDPLTIRPKDSTGPATKTASLDFTMKKHIETANELVDKITSSAVGKTFSIAYSTDLTVSGNKTVIINQIVSVLSLNPDEKTMLTNGTITGSPFVADGLTKDPLTIRPKDSTGPATKTASLDFTMDKKVAPIPGVNGLGKDKSVPFFDVTTADLVNPVSPDLAYNQFQTHNLMLAFVNTTNGKASWTPSDMFDNRSTKEAQWINQYETLGGHVGISFGGATGSQTGTLPWNVMTEQQLVQTFTEGIKLYNAQAFDFDIESAVGFEPEGFAKLINAINDIKTTYSKLDISFTFASLPIDKWGIKFWGSTSDLSSTSVPLLKKLKFAPIINPMAFDFGRYYTPTKAKYIPNIENVVETADAYWASIFNINADTFLKNNLELSIMIGRSDQDRQETVLAPTDVQTLSTYAKTKNLFRMGFWCLNRDFPGEFEPVDEHNSGTNNPAGIYSQTIKKYFE